MRHYHSKTDELNVSCCPGEKQPYIEPNSLFLTKSRKTKRKRKKRFKDVLKVNFKNCKLTPRSVGIENVGDRSSKSKKELLKPVGLPNKENKWRR